MQVCFKRHPPCQDTQPMPTKSVRHF